MKKTIVLIGLQDTSNMGDRLIYQCVDRLICRYLQNHEIRKYTTVSCDMLGKEYYRFLSDKKQLQAEARIRSALKKEYEDALSCSLSEQTESDHETAAFTMPAFPETVLPTEKDRIEALLNSAKKQALEIISADAAAVIFIGGGLIKYDHPLKLGYLIDIYTKRAQELDIPVMFSSVGVEGYDAADPECICMKNALNRPNIKVFTVRDDPDFFRKHYLEPDSSPKVAYTPCPAVNAASLFPVNGVHEKKRIGLCVIAAGKFISRHPGLTETDILNRWKEIISELERRGYQWCLFSDGVSADFDFGKKLLRFLNKPADEQYLLPRPTTVHQMLDYVNLFEGLIVSRLHAAISAYSYGVPCLSLVWNDKQLWFAQNTAQQNTLFEMNGFSAALLADRLEYLLKYRRQKPQGSSAPLQAIRCFLEEYVIPASERQPATDVSPECFRYARTHHGDPRRSGKCSH